MLANYAATPRKEKLLVVIAVVLFLRQKGPVPATSEVLLQTAVCLWVGVF
jgi:hypothetical protein